MIKQVEFISSGERNVPQDFDLTKRVCRAKTYKQLEVFPWFTLPRRPKGPASPKRGAVLPNATKRQINRTKGPHKIFTNL